MPDVPYVGKVAGLVEKKGGWYSVEIAVPGKQWPVKADTKLENLLTQVREIRDADLVATFTVSESDSENVNPNTGKPYTERRLSHVEVGAQNVPDATGSPSGSGGEGLTKEEWRRKDDAADARALTAIAVSALSHTVPSDPTEDDLKKFITRCAFLTSAWHQAVKSYRDGEDVPF